MTDSVPGKSKALPALRKPRPVVDTSDPETAMYLERLRRSISDAADPLARAQFLLDEVTELMPETIVALRAAVAKGDVNACIAMQRIQRELYEQVMKKKDMMPLKPEELGFIVGEDGYVDETENASAADAVLESDEESTLP